MESDDRMLHHGSRVLSALACLLPLLAVACYTPDASRTTGNGIRCGGFGRPEVQITVADSRAAAGGRITVTALLSANTPEGWHAVRAWFDSTQATCAASGGAIRVDATSASNLRIAIGATVPVPVQLRSASGEELAQTVYQPGASDAQLTWSAQR